MTVTGEYKNGVVVPHRPLGVREGTLVTIVTDSAPQDQEVASYAELKRAFREAAASGDEEWQRLSEMVQQSRETDLSSETNAETKS